MKKLTLFFAVVMLTAASFAQGIEFTQIQNWTGTGNNVAMLIFDFNDGQNPDCWAFGYRYEGTKTAQDMLMDIAAANAGFSVNLTGGFLNDIIYYSQEGIAGSPFYWMTFVYNDTTWEMNWDGIAEVLTDSMFFGCSYSDVDTAWNPLYLPENPTPAPNNTLITDYSNINVSVYPNPTFDYLTISTKTTFSYIEVFDLSGRLLISDKFEKNIVNLNVKDLSSGVFVMKVHSTQGNTVIQFVKQ